MPKCLSLSRRKHLISLLRLALYQRSGDPRATLQEIVSLLDAGGVALDDVIARSHVGTWVEPRTYAEAVQACLGVPVSWEPQEMLFLENVLAIRKLSPKQAAWLSALVRKARKACGGAKPVVERWCEVDPMPPQVKGAPGEQAGSGAQKGKGGSKKWKRQLTPRKPKPKQVSAWPVAVPYVPAPGEVIDVPW